MMPAHCNTLEPFHDYSQPRHCWSTSRRHKPPPTRPWGHADLERDYYLHVPATVETRFPTAGSVPLVLVLHGRGGTGPGTANLTGFDEVADENGFVVAYPTGVDNQWNYVEGIPGYALQTPDTLFMRAVVAELSARYPIDPAKVYVAGFSNGGYMAQHLACKATDLFAAYASVGAAGYGG